MWYSRSILRSENSIRATLLKHTPLGTKSEEVRAYVEKRGWLDRRYTGEGGYLKQEPGVPPMVVGVSSIKGKLGHYYLPLRADVTAFWGFDAEGRLIDVWVWKTVDG